ncbi:MAG: hypothetical protein ACXVII_40260 [Solirubrobacteraceae bacterium]
MAYSTPLQRYDSASGVPIVMLPDPDKDYNTDPIIATIWQQFEEALTRARIVLVLGHSLHDEALVAALRTLVEPPARLAVTMLPTESRDVAEMTDGAEVRARVQEMLPGAEILSCRFEQGPARYRTSKIGATPSPKPRSAVIDRARAAAARRSQQ